MGYRTASGTKRRKEPAGRAGSHGRSVPTAVKPPAPGADVCQSRGPDRRRAALSLSIGVSGEAKAEVMPRTHDHIVMYKRMGMAKFLSMNTPINPFRRD
jgi:hypothetical protein